MAGRGLPFEAVGRVLRDRADGWRANLAAELVPGIEGGRVGIGGVEGGDGLEEVGVVGAEAGEVEEL